MSDLPENDERPIFDLYAANMITRVTELAIRLDLFEHLREPLSVEELARKAAIGLRASETIVTALAALALVERDGEAVRLTPLSREYLVRASRFYKGHIFQTISPAELDMLRGMHLQDDTPRPVTTRWLAGKVSDSDVQAEFMHSQTFAAATLFARHPFFSSIRTLLDVAGGAGTIGIALAQHNPGLKCIVMDLKPMGASARRMREQHGVSDQVSFVATDMFKDPWPQGADAILFSNIFHDWDRPRNQLLANSAVAALGSGGHVIVSEMLLNDERTGPLAPALHSMMMLFGQLGNQLSFPQIAEILTAAGLVEIEKLTVVGNYTLVSGRKP